MKYRHDPTAISAVEFIVPASSRWRALPLEALAFRSCGLGCGESPVAVPAAGTTASLNSTCLAASGLRCLRARFARGNALTPPELGLALSFLAALYVFVRVPSPKASAYAAGDTVRPNAVLKIPCCSERPTPISPGGAKPVARLSPRVIFTQSAGAKTCYEIG